MVKKIFFFSEAVLLVLTLTAACATTRAGAFVVTPKQQQQQQQQQHVVAAAAKNSLKKTSTIPFHNKMNAFGRQMTTTTTTRLSMSNDNKNKNGQGFDDGTTQGNYFLSVVFVACLWFFTIPPEFRRSIICPESCIEKPNRSICEECVSGEDWINGIKEYYANGGGIQWDFSVDPKTKAKLPQWLQ